MKVLLYFFHLFIYDVWKIIRINTKNCTAYWSWYDWCVNHVCLDKMRSQWHGFVILLMIKTNDYVGYAIYALSGKWLLYAVNPYIKESTLF